MQLNRETTVALERFFAFAIAAEEMAHSQSSGAQEMRAALPRAVSGEFEIGFVDERGGLEGAIFGVAAQVGCCEAAQFGVDLR